MGENITKTISQMLQEIADDICDNYCKYRDTGIPGTKTRTACVI